MPAETLELTTAGITLLDNTRIQASGRVNQFQQEQKQVDLTVSSLYLDLDELIAFAAPFIPENVKTESSAGKKAFIALNTIRLQGFLPTGESDIRLDGLNLLLPDIGITDAADPAAHAPGFRRPGRPCAFQKPSDGSVSGHCRRVPFPGRRPGASPEKVGRPSTSPASVWMA